MSDYQIGAFEALEWAWHVLRSLKERPGGLEDARHMIQETLMSMGKGDKVNFSDRLHEIETVN